MIILNPDCREGSCREKASMTGKPQRKGISVAVQSNGSVPSISLRRHILDPTLKFHSVLESVQAWC